MFADVFDMLFGCWHRNYTFPITAKKANNPHSHVPGITGTYVVCLDCGKEFPYDWERMKVLAAGSEPTQPATLTARAIPGFGKVA
ncbi:MAG: hypothetical protein ABSD13_04550 [Candidatus Korobacteraceae bacterium]|jgi:hypothetical protein